MSIKEYRTAIEARGGLLIVKDTAGIAFGDRVHITDHAGNTRNGQVIRSADNEVLILVFEGTDDLDLENTWVRFPRRACRDRTLPRDPGARVQRSRRAARRPATGAVEHPATGRRIGHQSGRPDLSARVHPDRHLNHRRPEQPGARTEAADLLGLGSASQPSRRPDRTPGQAGGSGVELLGGLRRDGCLLCRRQILPRRVRQLRRAAQRGDVRQPRRRPAGRATHPASHGADRGGIPGLRPRPSCAGHPDRHDQLCRGTARGRHRQGRRPPRAKAIRAISTRIWPRSTNVAGASTSVTAPLP
jgi:hypothetical protein